MGRGTRTTISSICAAAVASATLAGVAAVPAAAVPAANETAAASVGAYCDVAMHTVAQWSTGYGVLLGVRNISDVPVRWRRLDLSFPGPIWSVQAWNVSYTQHGQQMTFVPSSSGVLQPGQTVTIGLIYASGSISTPPQPEVTCSPA
ncbi:cellulose binding domain-containing protein [Micromonospora sp. KC213]|uniref:cellulose binding domain-containing protein n=1 Tax=Micromonospora sp. KC213 TaxID=2530378 RepID=UPI0010514541|nr:cellulose binding domain-containing protein [Micromonospora sp. KC213]TDC42838.1 hypothetical protein E1166_06030 [Micromonospora sp. KC213]